MNKYITIILASLLVCSCVDTVILPEDKTVDEDFWQTKSDVASMVNGAYKSMLNANLVSRLIIWGDYRSDEMVPVTTLSGAIPEDLTEINAANVQTDNTFADWSSVYSVINNCNIVLEKASPVMAIDPNYTDGDYQTDRSQMLALRALCYFYLVRNFRDVPYSTTAYMTGSQDQNVKQAAPDSVLQCCVNDLVDAEKNSLDPTGYSDWRHVGYMNRDGIDALLADIYLWRASIKHSENDYKQCVDYCDKVIASKQAQHVPGRFEIVPKEYPLSDGDEAFTDLYVTQNDEESIFELQYDGSNNSNTGVCQYLYKYKDNNSTLGYLKASSIFKDVSTSNTYAYTTTGDYRFWNNIYKAKSSDETFDIRKMVSNSMTTVLTTAATGPERDASRTATNFSQNYIIYRLSDVMLMKAEALTQLAAGNSDIQLRQAFNLVQYVNNRSRYTGNLSDSLKWNTYKDKTTMETLVLQERLRELCFEGKRWYDQMRYNFRHVEGIDYSTTLAGQKDKGVTFVNNAPVMMNLMIRKYSSGGSSIASKMRTEPYLYMPIPKADVEINPNLRQNPAYREGDDYEKNV